MAQKNDLLFHTLCPWQQDNILLNLVSLTEQKSTWHLIEVGFFLYNKTETPLLVIRTLY